MFLIWIKFIIKKKKSQYLPSRKFINFYTFINLKLLPGVKMLSEPTSLLKLN